MENKIPTAKEFLAKIDTDIYADGPVFSESGYSYKSVHKMLKVFAKLHVEMALKEASTKALMDEDWVYDGENENHIYTGIDKDSILDAYPLTNII